MKLKVNDVTLDTRIPNGLYGMPGISEDEQTWTLRDAAADLKKRRLTGLLGKDASLSDLALTFTWAVNDGERPTVGQTLAAYYFAANDAAESAYCAGGIGARSYAARKAAITRTVFAKGRTR